MAKIGILNVKRCKSANATVAMRIFNAQKCSILCGGILQMNLM
jgi:hypothetical protein